MRQLVFCSRTGSVLRDFERGPMKILIVTGTYYPDIGGPSRYLYSLGQDLQSMGHFVELLTFGEDDLSLVDPFLTKRISRRLPVPLRMAEMGKAIWRASRDADLLYVNDYGLPAVLANKWAKKPLVMKIVGDFAWEVSVRRGWTVADVDAFQHQISPVRLRAVKALRDHYVGKADSIIVPSQYLKKLVSGWGVDSGLIHVIYNALDSRQYQENQNEGAPSSIPRLEGLTILTVARLAPWKGVGTLVEVLAKLPEFVRLVVVGDGPIRPSLEAKAARMGLEDRVQFVGAVPLGETHGYFADSDIFVLFSGYEGFSHVLLEASRAGLPIIASDRGGNPELIHHRQNGLLVPWPDTEGLEKALVEMVSDSELRAQLGKAAEATVARFSWNRLLTQTIEVLEAAAQVRS
jgi:glycosyltransferase involved in cell wall biosynthesis